MSRGNSDKVNRALRMYSMCNQAMLYATSEESLIAEICRIVVEVGGYRLAWIGFAGSGAEKSVVAQFLHPSGPGPFRDPQGQKAAATAISTGSRAMHAAARAPDDPVAAGACPATIAAFPLFRAGAAFGALTIHAVDPTDFDHDELTLLQELAGDMAFGINALQAREAQRTAEEALKKAIEAEQARSGELREEIRRRVLAEEELRARNDELVAAQEELRQKNEELTAIEEELRQQLSENLAVHEELLEKQDLLREVQKVALLGYYVFDITHDAWQSSEILDDIFGIDSRFERNAQQWLSIVSPDCRVEMAQYLSRLIRDGGRFDTEYKILRVSDGEERWVSGLGKLEYDSSGRAVRMIGTIQDVTARKRTEEALLETEKRFREVFWQHDDALLLLRLDTLAIVDANPAALVMFDRTPEELAALNPWDLIERQDILELTEKLPSDPADIFEVKRATACRKDGAIFTVIIRGKILRMKDEYLIYCSIRDITDKIRLEEEIQASQAKLIHANKMTSLGMLVSGIAHEINNPNHCISINASVLTNIWRDAVPFLQEVQGREGEFSLGGLTFSELLELAPELFKGIDESSRRITAIINDMRNYVKPEKGGVRGTVNINAVVGSAASLLWHHIQKHTVNFRMELQAGLPPAGGSSQQLEQVVINLMMNALQSLPDKSCAVQVETSFDRDRGQIAITVSDEGRGMSSHVLESVTTPFFTTRSDEGGTGLGLYISSSIVRDHAGFLQFDSEPGKGTIATILIPAA